MSDEHDFVIGRLVAQVESIADAARRIESKLDAAIDSHDQRIRGVETKLSRWGGIAAVLGTLWASLIAYMSGGR